LNFGKLTPLLLAESHSYYDICELLLKNNADYNISGPNGLSFLEKLDFKNKIHFENLILSLSLNQEDSGSLSL